MEILVPIALFVMVAFILVGMTRIISEGLTRRRLINQGASPELIQSLNLGQDANQHAALLWGIVLGAIGGALIVVDQIDYEAHEPLAVGIVLLFGAAGLLLYYVLVRRLSTH